MKSFLLFCLCFWVSSGFSQKQNYDLIKFVPPAGWTKETKPTLLSYTMTDKKKNAWGQVFLLKSTASKGTIDADFSSEWQELAVKSYKPGPPDTTGVEETDGWKIKSGMGKFVFNKKPAMVLVYTASGYGRCASVVAITNDSAYSHTIVAFLESLEMVKPASTTTSPTTSSPQTGTGAVRNTGFAFNTTNFDDGWTSTVQEDWVEVKKGSIRVLLHYPKEGRIFPADPAVLTTTAWNILVAPRYSNLKNFRTSYIQTYDRPYLGTGYATEKATGRSVFLVLFRQGASGWIEFVTPDKNAFIQQYKFDPEAIQWDSNSDLMIPLANMAGYNRFAVAASDFQGKWTSDFSGIQQLYYVYTGEYAGMNMNQSNEEFVFSGNSYNWRLLVVKGMVGNASATEVKSSGQFTVPNNWQISFSKIESGPKTFHAFWSCIKGARVLNLLDAQAPGSGVYTKYGLAK